jgi:hypothetical protein
VTFINKTLRYLSTLSLVLLLALPAFALDQAFSEDTLKALYSYKFALFTEWPKAKLDADNGTVEFCIIGKSPFSQFALESIEGKPVKDKVINVDVYNSGVVSEESLNNCHVAFISGSETQRLSAILSSLQGFPVLTISDIPGFSSRGGMVTLIKSGDHLQFEINQEAIKATGLTMSSKIVELATLVKAAKPGHI